jgi:exodeoxyribonuclease V gamma subunit
LIESVLSSLLPDAPGGLAYEPTSMLFGLARLLHEREDDAAIAEALRYCEGGQRDRRRFALAQRLADLFDQYLTYRPTLALEWEAGAVDDFQSALFRELARAHGRGHLPARARAALSRLEQGARPQGLPERLHVFGVSSLPPLYLDILAALSRERDIHLFLLSPTREYYGDLRSGRRKLRSQRRQLSFGDAGFRSEPHGLLASLGRHGREFSELLEERTAYVETADLYEDAGTSSLLTTIQSDLLALRVRGDGPQQTPRAILRDDDSSLAIHACHGPMREVEVLHDQLSALISERAIEPHEIVVMMPRIRDYAPVIEAVFSQDERQRPSIPFRIADRTLGESEPLIAALDALLDVLQGRFGANQVLDLLGLELVRARFEIAPDQVETLRDWVTESGIRWGVDAAHRAEVGQPARAENTWRFGLARLVLGFSTGASADRLFQAISPAAVDSSDAELLGNFLSFCDTLFSFRSELGEAANAASWSERVARLLAALTFGEGQDAAEQKLVRRALAELEAHAARAQFDEHFDLTTLRALLDRTLSSRLAAAGFLSGGVTFCQLMPMRSIPFKVLCMIGLNDGVFPASDGAFAFDLIQRDRKLGDRSRRDDDRQLFLEALLCARESLIISYIGQSLKDGKLMPPSVLVSELIDHVAENFTLAGESASTRDAIEARLVLRHPLSAASPRYFGRDPDRRLFSFSRAACNAATVSTRAHRRPPPFALGELPSARPNEISLADLERGLMRPSREFCQRRLALYLGDDLSTVEEREPFSLDALERWQIASELLEAQRRGDSGSGALSVLRAEGRLPLGAAGALAHRALAGDVSAIVHELERTARHERLPPVEVDLSIDGVRITGSLDELWSEAHVRAQYSRLNTRHELRHFIRCVALRCTALDRPELRLPERSILIGRKDDGAIEALEFCDFRDPKAALSELLRLYLSALNGPLPLFPLSSLEYAKQIHQGRSQDAALAGARAKFTSSGTQAICDDSDPYVAQLFPDFDAMMSSQRDQFVAAAESVYLPLFKHRRER